MWYMIRGLLCEPCHKLLISKRFKNNKLCILKGKEWMKHLIILCIRWLKRKQQVFYLFCSLVIIFWPQRNQICRVFKMIKHILRTLWGSDVFTWPFQPPHIAVSSVWWTGCRATLLLLILLLLTANILTSFNFRELKNCFNDS